MKFLSCLLTNFTITQDQQVNVRQSSTPVEWAAIV